MRAINALVLCTALGGSLPVAAALSDPNWTESVFSVNRNTPNDTSGKLHTGLAWAPDGSDRLFVLEKNGRARILSGALTTASPVWSTFATMTPIHSGGECGLIGMAFDPDFARNHYVYFFVSVSTSEQQIIRYDASTNIGSARTVVRNGLPTGGGNHNGGGIGFAGDGKLYWAIGDLGSGTGVDDDLTSLAAKVGRANRDGTLPAANPFDDGVGANNDFIFARGFRNPFTMQIQPSTGQIWLNVVGDGYEQVFVVGSGDHAGYNNFENNQPAGYITPKIVYRTNDSDPRSVTVATRSGNVATFTTSTAHRFRVGGNLTIAGVSDVSFNQSNLYVASVPTVTTFTAQQLGPNASSAGGQAATLDQGGCLTGGGFYDGTAAAADYRGNFFYGDCNSGRIMRARIDPGSNAVLSVDYWATGIATQVDVAGGPDGALYYTGTSTNDIYRAVFNSSGQALVVANQNLRVDEQGEAVTTVSLATAPLVDVTVTIARSAGDTDVNVLAGATLNFTPTNWMRPQAVRFGAAGDLDSIDDSATVSVSATGLTTVPVAVTVLDIGAITVPLFANGFEN
ncbi:MAG: PQQ-dependent sugar dehydrogenase [Pseudomonadota bacterium]|nr:PQQ-dependent sugar dehydrogenase [Pseudomonadota bacterium]